ncbi:aldo/keto reductase [Desulfopila aestuarii]|uniref:Predicted oxidoreductase n=1 Tax=Desulfopila aestuarii DSM 18488 TaxID=1121416 RepID=A0A1M7Y498_9BACT|nr:aldo/keto reductase [Desulfopila aestuarii]SHO47047.1 Predicted oxidoreductase [Desulfopila aestuarii DSM 18488]
MKKILLGKQGLQVPAIGLGCMGMSDFYGSSDRVNNLKVLEKALEIGCNFWDTADMYGPFTNERLLAEAFQGKREKIILATKFGVMRSEAGEWLGINGRPEYVKSCCDASLQRMGTDYIDLYYQHRVDPDVPIAETVGAMAGLVQEGKVKYIGLSEATPEQIRSAHQVHPITSLQTEYSLWSRDVEQEILPTIRELGIGFVAYSPMGRGFLSGEIQAQADLQEGDWRRENPRFQPEAIEHNKKLLATLSKHAADLKISNAQLALAWLLAQGDDIALIPGTRHEKYLLQNWQAMEIALTDRVIADLADQASKFEVEGTRY